MSQKNIGMLLAITLILTSCVSMPVGWTTYDTFYENSASGLVFPINTEYLVNTYVRPMDEETKEESAMWTTRNLRFVVQADIVGSEGLSFDRYLSESKNSVIKKHGLKKAINVNANTVTLNGSSYAGTTFRGYGETTKTKEGDLLTDLWSIQVFDLGEYYLKITSYGPYYVNTPTSVNGVLILEEDVLKVAFDQVK